MSKMVGYARVSTNDQSPQMQIDALEKAGCARIYHENASGVKDRPELKKALDYLREGDVLVVWKLDRLARRTKELIETVEELDRRKIGLRCLTQQIDTTTAGGRLVFMIFAAVAEFERELANERSRAGQQARLERGIKGGRKKALSPTQIDMARALMLDRKISTEKIAKQLGTTISTLYRSFPGGRTAVLQAELDRQKAKEPTA